MDFAVSLVARVLLQLKTPCPSQILRTPLLLTPTRPCAIVLRPFELRSCGQERGNDVDSMAVESLLDRVRILPCVPLSVLTLSPLCGNKCSEGLDTFRFFFKQLHAFSLVPSCKYPFPNQASIKSVLSLNCRYCTVEVLCGD